MWRSEPWPAHSERIVVVVPSKIVSALVTSSSNVGGITVVARAEGRASSTKQHRRKRERSGFIKALSLVIDSSEPRDRCNPGKFAWFLRHIYSFTHKNHGSRSNTSTRATPGLPS